MLEALLEVADRFDLGKLGTALAPDFDVPPGWQTPGIEQGMLLLPDGTERAVALLLDLTHFKRVDPVNRSGYRIIVRLPELRAAEVPAGARLLAPAALVRGLRGEK